MQAKPRIASARHNTIIGQRLKAEMKMRGIKSAELAQLADVKISFIYDVISGKSANPSTVKLARVAEALGIGINALVAGGEPSGGEGHEYVTIPRVLVDASAGGGSIVSVEREGESYYFRRHWVRENLGASPDDLRILNVRGDSMEPTLCHNDLILIDTRKKSPTPPGVFVVYDGMGLVAKRLELTASGAIRIISDNPHYSAYERSPEESFIIGRVVWFGRVM